MQVRGIDVIRINQSFKYSEESGIRNDRIDGQKLEGLSHA